MSVSLLKKLNPLSKLGNKSYSVLIPFLITLLTFLLIETYAYLVGNPLAVGTPAIFSALALTIYFSARDGVRGGAIAAVLSVGYYLYIIYSRNYTGQQLTSGVVLTFLLGALYLIVALVLGWLRQRIDTLIEKEAYEKIRLQAILKQLPAGVLITGPKNKIEYINQQLEKMIDGKVEVGDSINNHENPFLTLLYKTARQRKATAELKFEGKNKRIRYFKISNSEVLDKKGKQIAKVFIVDDISLEKELEKRKDDFINMASHELKTPLTSLNLYASLFKKNAASLKNEKHTLLADNIKTQIERLQRLVDDLLDVSRIQTGKLTFSKDKFRLDDMIEETLEIFQASTPQNLVLSKKNQVSLVADKFRIYQVFANILSNAIKYSSSSGDIIVEVKKINGQAVVSVKDSGIGISKQEQTKIFDRLYQVNEETVKTFPGFGMGLYISKEIIKRHKGRIWVDSEKDKGSTFYFSLPIN